MGGEPWWASGSTPDHGLDGSEDPFDAHRRARHGDEAGGSGPDDETGRQGADGEGTDDDVARLASDAIDLVARLASEAGRRFGARSAANAGAPPRHSFTRSDDPQDAPQDAPPDDQATTWRRLADGVAPHADGQVCDACPICIGLRALRQARPDVVAHLSDAAHHVSLALRALADAQAGDDGLEKIDLDQ